MIKPNTDTMSVVKTVTILISDIRGFVAYTERYPTLKVIELLNNYLSEMTKIIFKYDGVIDKYIGDSILAVFEGDVDTSVNRSLACALEMQIAMEQVNAFNQAQGMDSFYMGIGINTGEVVSCVLGPGNFQSRTVIGNHVNLAARVEAFSLRGQILISENTYLYAKKYISVGKSNQVSVKGKKESVNIIELLAILYPSVIKLPARDNRSEVRIGMDFPIRYQFIEGKEVKSAIFTATVDDLSYSGVRFLSDFNIDPYSDLKIYFASPVLGFDSGEVYAKVMRSKPTINGFDVGITFTSIDDKACKSIKSYVDSMI